MRVMTPQHILVPLDFSEPADEALMYAITMAKQLQARITLLHVIDIPPLAGANLTTQMFAIEEAAQRAADVSLQRVRDAGVQGESLVNQGIPWQEIVQQAKVIAADLIIMGTHGRTGLQHVFLGSVAEKVVRLAPCPVLVVRTPAATTTA
jgi:nucleotide-binding universal stress UspA family protein